MKRDGFRLLLAVLVAGFAAWQLRPFLMETPRALAAAGLIKDDAFFYGTLVNNFRAHGFFTMDGRMPTNGFQPLWMFVILGLKTVASGADTMHLVLSASWASWVALSFGAVWLVAEGTWHVATARVALLAGLVLLNQHFQLANVQGLEVAFTLLVVVGTLVYARRVELRAARGDDKQRVPTRSAAVLGALGALCFLGRTDLFWFVPALAVWLWWLADRDRRPLLACCGAAAVVVVPYLLWNLIGHGGLMPLSGRAKLFFLHAFYPTSAAYWASEEWKGMFTLFGTWLPESAWETQVGLTLAVLAVAHGVAWSPWSRRELPDWIRVLSVTVLLHTLYMQFVYRELRPYTEYYFAPEVLFVGATLALWIAALESRLARAALLAWLLVTSSATWGALELKPSSYWTTRLALAEQLPRLAHGRRVAAFWPGCFGWFSGVEITPLDGITGSNEFLKQVVEQKREIDWALDQGIRIVVTAGNPGLLGPRPPRIGQWSELGNREVWASRQRFRVVGRSGPWMALEVTR